MNRIDARTLVEEAVGRYPDLPRTLSRRTAVGATTKGPCEGW